MKKNKIHRLKTVNPFFDLIKNRQKNFEFRKNDRDFKQGQTVVLMEYDSILDKYSGQWIRVEILYVMTNKDFPLVPEGYVIFSFKTEMAAFVCCCGHCLTHCDECGPDNYMLREATF